MDHGTWKFISESNSIQFPPKHILGIRSWLQHVFGINVVEFVEHAYCMLCSLPVPWLHVTYRSKLNSIVHLCVAIYECVRR